MSGGSDKQSSGPPKWATPYFKNAMDFSQQVANQPYQAYGGSRVAQMNPYETQGYNAQAQRALQGSPVNQAAGQQLTDTLGGKYLGSNPYLNSAVDAASQDVNRNYDQVAARSGSFGNSGVEESRTRALADSANAIRYQDYGAERGRMQSALGYAPSIANQDYVDADRLTGAGSAFRDAEQANISDDYGQFTEARDYPKDQLGTLLRGLGINSGNTSTTKQGSNPLNTAIGAASAYYGSGK